ncbi:MAG: flippase-like domain-containing protein [Clostridia bacterium]|nr:flippase-like domain-containing protein [Clostridia bacterium]
MKKDKKLQENEQLRMPNVPKESVHNFSAKETERSEEVFSEDISLQVSEGQLSIFESPIGETLIDDDVVRDKLQEAIENEKPKKKKKSVITNLIFLAINLVVLFFIINSLLKDTENFSLSKIVAEQGKKLWWLAGALGLVVLYFLADTLILNTLIKKTTGKSRMGLAYKTSVTGRYFDDITPFSVGGEPAQILSLAKGGVAPGVATSIPLIKFILYTMVYSILIFCFLVFAAPHIPRPSNLNNLLLTLFKILAYIGLIFTALVSVVYTLIGSGKIVGRSLVRKIVRFGYKLRIVKDYRKSYNKIMSTVLEYQSSIRYLRKNLGTMFICAFLCLVEMLALFGMPYMIVMALAPGNVAPTGFMLVIICITKSIICQMASVVMPLPGGTGMMEISFISLFGISSLLGHNVVWGLLAWRFLTYYFNIIQGFTLTTIDNLVKISKAKKEAKLAMKQQESVPSPEPLQENTLSAEGIQQEETVPVQEVLQEETVPIQEVLQEETGEIYKKYYKD